VWGSDPGRGNKFYFLQNVQTSYGTHSASFSVATGVKRPERVVDHSLPSNAEVKSGAILLLPLYASMAWTWAALPFLSLFQTAAATRFQGWIICFYLPLNIRTGFVVNTSSSSVGNGLIPHC
jgi:hypothetical protein